MIYLFHSRHFLVFFAVVFALFWFLPKRFKNAALLISRYIVTSQGIRTWQGAYLISSA
ncbi:MAG: hypothetical protein KJ709_09755 [Nanoarchaeota archaeon]|nr:hypothetical protein [Nanoarchaeota archaeon]